jgi:transcription antitermination factor NusG
MVVHTNTIGPWFALQTRARSEKKVAYLLRQKGYECLTPTYCQKRRWSDRVVEVDLPLFPMYVFCRLDSSVLGKAISTPGVLRIVGFGGKPAEVAVEEIEALQLLARSNLLREPWKYLPDGTRVLVETGPLTGVQGVICQGENNRQLIISITLLHRSVAVQLDENTAVSVVAGSNEGETGYRDGSNIAVSILRRMYL